MKIALVHDYLVDAGGAERALLELHRLFPNAPIYTSVYSPSTTMPEFRNLDVRTTYLQSLRPNQRNYKYLLPMLPSAFSRLDMKDFDIVISSSSAFSKCVQARPGAAHVCYCYTPPRFIYSWDLYRRGERINRRTAALVTAMRPYLRHRDQLAARRVDRFIAISETVRERIKRHYTRTAEVIYPPIPPPSPGMQAHRAEFFLIVSRLLPYKQIDTAVEAFTRLNLPLIVVGDGPDRRRLEGLAGTSVRFTGRLPDGQLPNLYAECRALILPGEEDLGLTPLEANALGTPVIALGRGGARETVIPGGTGILYDEPTVECLEAAVRSFRDGVFDRQRLRQHAASFSRSEFQRRLGDAIEEAVRSKRVHPTG